MKAILQKRLKNNIVKCNVCEHYCVIKENETGICGMRVNILGTLYVLNYGKTISYHIDPIIKKPLNHFLNNSYTYSLSAPGCNFACPWCQNHEISQIKYYGIRIDGKNISPLEHIKKALKAGVPSISYTYTEPTIFLEYALDIMKKAKEKGLYNIWVTNGYMSEETLDLILPYLDAVNIDYKTSNDKTYRNIIKGSKKPILRNIKKMYEKGIHVEITTLLVPSINESIKEIEVIASEISSISKDIPWHITRFFPSYKFNYIDKTDISIINKAYKIGLEKGLKYIYLGNI